jgi:hypothetical protein
VLREQVEDGVERVTRHGVVVVVKVRVENRAGPRLGMRCEPDRQHDGGGEADHACKNTGSNTGVSP